MRSQAEQDVGAKLAFWDAYVFDLGRLREQLEPVIATTSAK